jgi:hypothetical protein
MVYLDRAPAAQVADDGDLKVERLANGGALFTSVAGAIFDGSNTDHWAAAARLQAALVPLNESESDGDK